ncbi:unnamed protein product [Sphagnum troendelagicum]|uniref:Secreted protein n=1 Tax=Sphagnum troendelagicum TaxID=128251 RepID=A0ABP0UT37_9BRYO
MPFCLAILTWCEGKGVGAMWNMNLPSLRHNGQQLHRSSSSNKDYATGNSELPTEKLEDAQQQARGPHDQ